MILLEKKRRTAADAWIDSCDPLNGLSIAQAKAVYNAARRNGSPLLQKIYAEIESADPVLMTCVERRQSALAGLGWRTVADASAADAVLAEEQRRALEEFADGIANLDEAIEHLDLAFFRGHSVVQPIWEGGAVRTVSLLESWNFLRDADGRLLWNPDCSYDPAACEEIPPSAMCVALLRRRAIDWPALSVYIRKHVGERDWGRFLERYGLPPVDAVMAPNATEAQRGDYVQALEDAHDGRSTAWPSGTTVSRAEGARGQDPFSAFVEHQEKQIVLMATGGTLTSLAQADTGSLAGGAQMDVWEQIVQRDGVAISGALHRGLFVPFLRRAFPGRPALARLVLGRETEPTADEAADLAGKLRAAGYRVDQSQLEEATGFKLEREETPAQPGFGGFGGFANKAAPQDPDSGVAKPLQNARRGSGATDAPKDGETRSTALLRGFAADMGPAAGKIKSLLDGLEAGRDVRDEARRLAGELPDLMADDPAMAAVIEEAMAEAFAAGAGEGEAALNKEGECRAKDPAHCPVHGTPNRDREPETRGQRDRLGNANERRLAAEPKLNAERGGNALDEVMRNKGGYVDKAMYREETGWIRFDWGDPGNPGADFKGGHGLSHIAAKHPEDLKALPNTLANGEVRRHEDPSKLYVVTDTHFAVLAPLHGGAKKTITEFAPTRAGEIDRIRKNPLAKKPGEN